jgi:hypothetical protein
MGQALRAETPPWRLGVDAVQAGQVGPGVRVVGEADGGGQAARAEGVQDLDLGRLQRRAMVSSSLARTMQAPVSLPPACLMARPALLALSWRTM